MGIVIDFAKAAKEARENGFTLAEDCVFNFNDLPPSFLSEAEKIAQAEALAEAGLIEQQGGEWEELLKAFFSD